MAIFSWELEHNVPVFLIRYMLRVVCGPGDLLCSHTLCVQYKSARRSHTKTSLSLFEKDDRHMHSFVYSFNFITAPSTLAFNR